MEWVTEMDKMIDFHSHILPKIDDGSKSSDESIEMLLAERQQGVSDIIATPHFYAHDVSISHFLERRKASYDRLFEKIALKGVQADVPKIHVGAEAYYFPGMGRAEELSKLCVNEGDLLLLEMPFAQWTKDVLKDVEQILHEQKLRVMLAHVERFYGYQKKKDIWDEVLSLPIIFQINAGGLEDRKERKVALKLLKEELPIVMGSDCHGIKRRPPNLASGRNIVEKKMGTACLEQIDELGQRIMEDE